ncbi:MULTISPECIES: ectoine/hydroxyectoine ABC transporter permease subunit EhuD [unclassified Cryobacterium]|uniref:ectoine/hydroxyectoine ABC transporter permease subunit EhuD n=1 Tax=unclassified Cryobacterium TaxID=2649013 RepID=UPI000CE2C554|nr:MULTISPECIES: ectoine/hydroxyectoine ABC transporter permease subunit EhuD [unclassified Cryobacterium]
MTDLWSWDRAFQAVPVLLEGFQITLLATALGMVVAAILGLAIAISRRSQFRIIRWPVGAMNEFIRQTPLVVQLVFAYYLFTSISPLQIGITVIGIHYATYMSEVYRAGIDGVAPGQWEATRALSMGPVRTWRAVILPQAIRSTLPALGNYAVSMFKETPFLFAISVVEMVTAAQQFGAQHFQYIEAITLAGLIFLIASYPTSLLIRKLETRLAY